MIATLATLFALTIPQRRALSRALVFWSASELAIKDPASARIATIAQALVDGTERTVFDADLPIILAFAPIALDLNVDGHLANTLRRAYAGLGITTGAGASLQVQAYAKEQIRNLANPPLPEQTPIKYIPAQGRDTDPPCGEKSPPMSRVEKRLECTLDPKHTTDHMATGPAVDGREPVYLEWRHAIRCGNGRKCRYHATGADRKWSCGPDAYEPSHGSDDPAVVGEQETEDTECQGHPAGPFDPQGETVYCDGSCRRTVPRRTPPAPERYWSGEGHPTLALCASCWNPPRNRRSPVPVANRSEPPTMIGDVTPAESHNRSGEPDLDFTSAPLPKGYIPPPSSGAGRFPGSVLTQEERDREMLARFEKYG